jgi:transcriptional regulator with XRE-family HTH domain
MEVGNKIYELRKNAKLSQEQLAEKINVTRQTISNWELGQTVPDIIQATEISKIFNITLDELVDNNVKDILVEKISNTEKTANKTLKTIKILCIIMICFLVFIILTNIGLFEKNKNEYIEAENQIQIKEQQYREYRESLTTKQFNCTLNQQDYEYSIQYDTDNTPVNFRLSSLSVETNETLFYNLYNYFNEEYENYTDAMELIKDLEQYFENQGGTWEEIK